MLRKPNQLGKDCSGGALIFVGLSILTLVAAMATAIDMGRVFLARSKAQTAVDSAVLAASSIATKSTPMAEVEARADKFFAANYPTGYLDTTINNFSLVKTNGEITGSVQLTQDTYFANFVGLEQVEMRVNSQVNRELSANRMEIALVLDHTASMCVDNSDNFNAITCSKFKELGLAVETLVTELKDAVEASSDVQTTVVYYSYIPFNHDRKINDQMLYNPDYADYLPNVMGLRSNGDQIVSALKATKIEDLGGTNTAIGTLVGWQSLRPQNQGIFRGKSAEQVQPSTVTDRETYKIMILLTDGQNEFVTIERGRPECQLEGCAEPHPDLLADADQRMLCPLIKDQGIEVFSVVFDVPPGGTIENIFRGCASEPKNMHYFRAEQGGLQRVFQRIANTLIDLRITM